MKNNTGAAFANLHFEKVSDPNNPDLSKTVEMAPQGFDCTLPALAPVVLQSP